MCTLCNETGWREHTESDEVMGLITVSEMCTCLENGQCPRCGGDLDEPEFLTGEMYCQNCKSQWSVS